LRFDARRGIPGAILERADHQVSGAILRDVVDAVGVGLELLVAPSVLADAKVVSPTRGFGSGAGSAVELVTPYDLPYGLQIDACGRAGHRAGGEGERDGCVARRAFGDAGIDLRDSGVDQADEIEDAAPRGRHAAERCSPTGWRGNAVAGNEEGQYVARSGRDKSLVAGDHVAR